MNIILSEILSRWFYFMISSILFSFLLLSSVNAQEESVQTDSTDNLQQELRNQQAQRAEMLRRFRWWELEISKKPYFWYLSDEGRRMAENILSWQYNGTGWPLMNTVDRSFTGDESKAGPWGRKAALVKATVNEIRFLARAYHATDDERYLKALLGGLDYILEAQHESGGWPHTYPYRMTDYHHYASFNDDVITDKMILLGEILNSQEFKAIGEENLKRVKDAYDKGLDFILKSQILVDGKLTAWAQQYDEITYEPRAARAFEPAALSGGESANILSFLMSIRKPSPEVIRAVEAGVNWYHDVQIHSMELVRTVANQYVRYNPSAPPLWARYYEIGTNKPIFAGRDTVIRYDLAEVEQERRRGYSWYNYHGTEVFGRYGEWQHERLWDDQPSTNIDESKVGNYSLPDPLTMANGKAVNSIDEWENKRRLEILELFRQHQHGRIPEASVETAFEIIERDKPVMDGAALRTQGHIHFPEHADGPVIRVLLCVPAEVEGTVPALLHISFSPNVLLYKDSGIDEGMAWDVRRKIKVPDREALHLQDIDPAHFIEQGYAIATVYYGDIEPDFDHGGAYGVRTLFEKDSARQSDEWGAIGAWSWGLSRVLDYLQTVPIVDHEQVAVSGVSRLGKTALWTAARDQRFGMAIPIVSGEGGAALSRRHFGETVADLTNPHRYDYWYAPRYQDYAFDVNELPVDGHMLLSLMAPRPILLIVGIEDTWSDPKGEWLAAKAAEPVYELYGLEGPEAEEFPIPGMAFLNDLGFFMHDAGHTVLPEDFKVMTDFMDEHFNIFLMD